MLCAGLVLRRERLDFRLLDGEGATVDAVPRHRSTTQLTKPSPRSLRRMRRCHLDSCNLPARDGRGVSVPVLGGPITSVRGASCSARRAR